MYVVWTPRPIREYVFLRMATARDAGKIGPSPEVPGGAARQAAAIDAGSVKSNDVSSG
jgi:hypothetical protein